MKYCNSCQRIVSGSSSICSYCGSSQISSMRISQTMEDFQLKQLVLNGVNYYINGVIGVGGFALILVGERIGDGGKFAIKVPLSLRNFVVGIEKPNDDKKYDETLRKEIEYLVKLQHPNIIQVVDSGYFTLYKGSRKRSFPVYIMPLAEGNLEEFLSTGVKLSIHEKIEIIKDVAKALIHLHSNGYVYRDLSLKNVLILDNGVDVDYVLCDFGGARITSLGMSHSTVVGTPRYTDKNYFLHPEVYRSDPRIDIYSFGVLITELLLDTPNWVDKFGYQDFNIAEMNFAEEIVDRYVTGDIGIYRDVLRKATNNNIERRYGTVYEFLNDFLTAADRVVTGGAYGEIKEIEVLYNVDLSEDFSSLGGKTLQIPIVYYKGGVVKINLIKGGEISFPFTIKSGRIESGPSFVNIVPLKSGVRLWTDIARLKSTLSAFAPKDIEGFLEFKGKILVEV